MWGSLLNKIHYFFYFVGENIHNVHEALNLIIAINIPTFGRLRKDTVRCLYASLFLPLDVMLLFRWLWIHLFIYWKWGFIKHEKRAHFKISYFSLIHQFSLLFPLCSAIKSIHRLTQVWHFTEFSGHYETQRPTSDCCWMSVLFPPSSWQRL